MQHRMTSAIIFYHTALCHYKKCLKFPFQIKPSKQISLRLQPCTLNTSFLLCQPSKFVQFLFHCMLKALFINKPAPSACLLFNPDEHQIHDRWVYSDNSALLLFICILRLKHGIWRAGRKYLMSTDLQLLKALPRIRLSQGTFHYSFPFT